MFFICLSTAGEELYNPGNSDTCKSSSCIKSLGVVALLPWPHEPQAAAESWKKVQPSSIQKAAAYIHVHSQEQQLPSLSLPLSLLPCLHWKQWRYKHQQLAVWERKEKLTTCVSCPVRLCSHLRNKIIITDRYENKKIRENSGSMQWQRNEWKKIAENVW